MLLQQRDRPLRVFNTEDYSCRITAYRLDVDSKERPDKDTYPKADRSHSQADRRHFNKASPEIEVLGSSDIEIEDEDYQYTDN